MPHQKPRHLLSLFQKRLKLWPVLGLLGARQVGKSTLLRDQLAPRIGASYVTLDDLDIREQARRRPAYFLQSFEGKPLILDEVQKVPDLFDAIKANVDRKRIPGCFLLSGSTEFSKKTGIHESMTGRMGLFRLHPMTLAETLEEPLKIPWVDDKFSSNRSSSAVNKRIEQGGFPGVCFLRNPEERKALLASWLETTCYRDLQQIRGSRLSGDLAMQVLRALARLGAPPLPDLVKEVGIDARRVRSHIEALEALFVVQHVNGNSWGVKKAVYSLCDSGLARYCGASIESACRIWLLNEAMAQFEAAGVRVQIEHYVSSKGSVVDFVIEKKNKMTAYILCFKEAPGTYELRPAYAFLKKQPQAQIRILTPTSKVFHESKNIIIVPWQAMA